MVEYRREICHVTIKYVDKLDGGYAKLRIVRASALLICVRLVVHLFGIYAHVVLPVGRKYTDTVYDALICV